MPYLTMVSGVGDLAYFFTWMLKEYSVIATPIDIKAFDHNIFYSHTGVLLIVQLHYFAETYLERFLRGFIVCK